MGDRRRAQPAARSRLRGLAVVRPDVDRSRAARSATAARRRPFSFWRRRGRNSGRRGAPRPHHNVISLAPLDDAQVQRMIAELASRRTLSTDVMRRVSERAGGVPLFVEEVTQLVLERGERRAPQAIPPTLRQSLAARLDRLGTSARSRADRRSAGPKFLLCVFCATSRLQSAPVTGLDEACAPIRAGPPRRRRPSVRRRLPAGGELPFQARADSGRGLRQPA